MNQGGAPQAPWTAAAELPSLVLRRAALVQIASWVQKGGS